MNFNIQIFGGKKQIFFARKFWWVVLKILFSRRSLTTQPMDIMTFIAKENFQDTDTAKYNI